MAHSDNLGDRMKEYEKIETKRRFLPMLPVCARIDGRSFSTFTKSFNKPFDLRLRKRMVFATQKLIEQSHALIGYTQSDEITLIFEKEDYYKGMFFDGKMQKMCSVLAGLATAAFSLGLDPEHAEMLPHFDCRVWQVPTRMEAANVLLWRAMDARKNAISAACRSLYSAKEMHGKNQEAMLAMLTDAGVEYEKFYAKEDREGTYVRRVTHTSEMDTTNVIRSKIVPIPMPFFGDVDNRVNVIFEGATPIKRETT